MIFGPLSGPVRDTPHIAQYLFEIVSQRRVSHPLALFSCGIAQVSLRYPFCGLWAWSGYRTYTSHALQRGNAQKRGRGVSHPNWSGTYKRRRQKGVSLICSDFRSKSEQPRAPSETSVCRGVKIAAGQFLPLSCRSMTIFILK